MDTKYELNSKSISDKIDTLTYKLYKIEKKIKNLETYNMNKWHMIYEPILHSDIDDYFIIYKNYEEYYDKLLESKKYNKLMIYKNKIETEISFYYKELNKLEPMY